MCRKSLSNLLLAWSLSLIFFKFDILLKQFFLRHVAFFVLIPPLCENCCVWFMCYFIVLFYYALDLILFDDSNSAPKYLMLQSKFTKIHQIFILNQSTSFELSDSVWSTFETILWYFRITVILLNEDLFILTLSLKGSEWPSWQIR